MKKGTVAFLTRSLVDATGISIWNGIKKQCKANNKPLITFRGPLLNKGNGTIIYELLDDYTYDGIISWASSNTTPDVIQFYQKFKNTKVITMTFRVPGRHSVTTDCKSGMVQLMNHLIEDHKYTKIAFVKGPLSHVYANERYDGYIEALNNHNIAINQSLITEPGGWGIKDGEKGVKELLDRGLKPGSDIDAICCVGDNVAIGAVEYLQAKGYAVPGDVAVCGFNGTDAASCTNPPITTVHMPFTHLGKKAYAMLYENYSGDIRKLEQKLVSSLTMGQSCGCKSQTVDNATARKIIEKNIDGKKISS